MSYFDDHEEEILGIYMPEEDEELAAYFLSKQGFNRLFNCLKRKYISLGKYSGSFKIQRLTGEEAETFTNFFGTIYKKGSTAKMSFDKINKTLKKTKYKNFTWDKLFLYYFGSEIPTKKQVKEEMEQTRKQFFEEIFEENKDFKYINKLKTLLNDKPFRRMLYQKYKSNSKKLKIDLNNIIKLIDNIPDKPVTLSVYASLTGSPHYLDIDTNTSNFFLKILAFTLDEEYIEERQKKIDLFSSINVYTDVLSNNVITYKLTGNPCLDSFSKANLTLNINLEDALKFDNVTTKTGQVFIFENPSMLITLKPLKLPIIITSGIPNACLYTLLDKLEKNNVKMYYNGDFDPEGLLIAYKLKQKYKDLELFCYDKEDYNEISKQIISVNRLKEIENINLKEIEEVKTKMLEIKYPSYQENNIENIKKYLKKEGKK